VSTPPGESANFTDPSIWRSTQREQGGGERREERRYGESAEEEIGQQGQKAQRG
jgi:hypothetical protein